jgi:hypothetical protein
MDTKTNNYVRVNPRERKILIRLLIVVYQSIELSELQKFKRLKMLLDTNNNQY